jgi:hypothetical protein
MDLWKSGLVPLAVRAWRVNWDTDEREGVTRGGREQA